MELKARDFVSSCNALHDAGINSFDSKSPSSKCLKNSFVSFQLKNSFDSLNT